jgi:hypothetical protein
MENCEFVEKCPIFARFKHEGAKNIWLQHYCLNRHGVACQRKKLRQAGKSPLEIPSTMLPNGLVLEGADYSARTFDSRGEEDCIWIQDCMTMFARFHDPDSKIFWATRFCFRSKGQTCERNKRIQEGTDPALVPANLLPNGDCL